MTSKLSNLQSALDRTRLPAANVPATPRRKAAAAPAAVPAPAPARSPALPASRQDNRRDKVNMSAWVDPAFKDSVRLIQARKRGATMQSLFEEALNDLFAKYDVPQVIPGPSDEA